MEKTETTQMSVRMEMPREDPVHFRGPCSNCTLQNEHSGAQISTCMRAIPSSRKKFPYPRETNVYN